MNATTRGIPMPLRLASCALLLGASTALAQPFALDPPRLRVARGERPIDIAALDLHVAIHGLHAETTQTLVFSNPNGRVLEGDLEFPLPDGATVSGFALDVGGQLVDAVVVSKQKARVVLETEVRKGVDPGLVEQVRGNVYRARVYPIPANGTRTVRLRWVSELTARGDEAAFRLPLPYGRPLPKVSVRVEVVGAPAAPEASGGFGKIALARRDDRWVGDARLVDAAASRDLLVRLPRLPAQLVSVEPGEGGEAFFSLSDAVPEVPAEAAPAPRRIALAWDASGSRDRKSTEREIAFLRALLAAWPGTAVDLVVFRNRPQRPQPFPAGDGGKKLEAALRGLPADGGTALGALDLRRAALPSPEDDLWIVASDGLVTLGDALPRSGDVPVFTVTGAAAADRALLRHLAARSGGDLLDLLSQDPPAAAAAMTAPRVRLLKVASDAGAVADLQISPRADAGRVHVTGRLLADEADLTLGFGAGHAILQQRVVRIRRAEGARAGEGAGPVATAWAQARAEALGLFPDRNEKELLALGRRFGLVTAGTSLLVLETLAQHLEHGVEPAPSRAALRAEYLARTGAIERRRHADEKARLERVVAEWKERVRWWETRFDAEDGRGSMEEEHPERRDGGRGAGPGLLDRLASSMRRAMEAPPAPAAAPARVAGAPAFAAAPAEAFAKASQGARTAGTEASISVQPWDPNVPYLEPLRRAAPGAAYRAYLAERARHAGPAFFLDCAGFFLRSGEKALGIRVLSNLAELRIDDAALLRVLAWRLAEAGELDLAAGVLEKVLRLRPEEPQSRRDLALVLADRAEATNRPADAARAVALLWEVGRTTWDRFPEVEIIALMELNRVLARAERRGWAEVARAPQVDGRLRKLLDLDLRVSLSWDADMTDVDLHLFEPTGEHAFYGHQRTRMGGLVSHDVTGGYGPEEYVARRAAKGAYAVKVHYYGSGQQTLVGPATMIATVYTNFGRPDDKREVLTLRLADPRDMEEVGVVRIGGPVLRTAR